MASHEDLFVKIDRENKSLSNWVNEIKNELRIKCLGILGIPEKSETGDLC